MRKIGREAAERSATRHEVSAVRVDRATLGILG